MTLPYENATSGKDALNDMQKVLRGFGAAKFGVMDDFESGSVNVQFEWKGRRVEITASAKGYAAAWLREHPYSSRMRLTRSEHEKKALRIGGIAIYSMLRDWIKGQVTAVEVGILSFEGAFLGQILLPNGETILDRVDREKILPALAAPS